MKTILETRLAEKEDRLAQQLRQACDKNGKEIDIDESGRIFLQLGRIYRQRSPDKFSLIRNEVIKDETNQRLSQTHPIDDNVNIEEQEELEKKKIAEIEEVQNMITLRYKEKIQFVSQECVGLMGKAPCEFALVGLGSLAKKEVTPYSDFENIILLEEFPSKNNNYLAAVEYFRWFSLLFHIILINLKETIIPCLDISSLRDEKSEKCWFYDVATKRGVSFDRIVCPLGRSPNHHNSNLVELIKTVSDMLMYLEPEFTKTCGYYLSEFLTKPCFIYGNPKIYSSYSEEVSRRIKLFVNHTAVSEQLEDDINNFEVFTKFSQALFLNKCNVKRVFYRSTTLFIYAVGQICNLEGDSCFDIVRQLLAAGRIDAANAHSLKYAVAVSCETRLKVYGSFGRAADDLENFTNEIQKHLQSLVSLNSLIKCVETGHEMQSSLKKKLGMLNFSNYSPFVFRCLILHSLGYHHRVLYHFSRLLVRDLKRSCFTAFVEKIVAFMGVCSVYYVMLYGVLNVLYGSPGDISSVPLWIKSLYVMGLFNFLFEGGHIVGAMLQIFQIIERSSSFANALLNSSNSQCGIFLLYILCYKLSGYSILNFTYHIIVGFFLAAYMLTLIYCFVTLFQNDAILCTIIVCSTLFSHRLDIQTRIKLPALLPLTMITVNRKGGNWAWYALFTVLVASADNVNYYVSAWIIPYCVVVNVLAFCALAAFFVYDKFYGVKRQPYFIRWPENAT
ncbi:unnamed protein product [Clavelina lepadiformis]|uniref:Protein-PII uridylyltransferase N-terminal domain-containing protein n=1 Tax=Clavelina lepadiformis TaxID=159417 RepID=A0ABP0GUS8_CLALP